MEDVLYWSWWGYNPEADTWIPIEEENPTSYIFCGYRIQKDNSSLAIDSDFSGTWELISGNPITISEFTPDHFTASWGENTVEFHIATSLPHSFDTSKKNVLWYDNREQGYYLSLTLTESKTTISIFTYTGTVNLVTMTTIEEDLPKLNNQ